MALYREAVAEDRGEAQRDTTRGGVGAVQADDAGARGSIDGGGGAAAAADETEAMDEELVRRRDEIRRLNNLHIPADVSLSAQHQRQLLLPSGRPTLTLCCQILDLPPASPIDERLLSACWRGLARSVHPDKWRSTLPLQSLVSLSECEVATQRVNIANQLLKVAVPFTSPSFPSAKPSLGGAAAATPPAAGLGGTAAQLPPSKAKAQQAQQQGWWQGWWQAHYSQRQQAASAPSASAPAMAAPVDKGGRTSGDGELSWADFSRRHRGEVEAAGFTGNGPNGLMAELGKRWKRFKETHGVSKRRKR